MRKLLVCGIAALCLAGCSPDQIATAQKDQAIVQAVLDAACTNNAIEQLVAAAVPEVGMACVAGKMAAPVVTAVMNDPALMARVASLAAQAKALVKP